MRAKLGGVFFLLLACGCFHSASAAESIVRIDDRIDGKLVIPEGETKAAVVLYHGWNGHMDEVGNLYADLAAILAERGIASLRFNFNGEGPQGDFVVSSTLGSRIAEASLAFEFLKNNVQVQQYGAVGFSLGGLTTMAVIGEHPEWFDSIVLWSAAEAMNFPDQPEYHQAASKAILEGEATFQSWTTITITREYVASFAGVHVGDNLRQYSGSLLSIRGSKDRLPTLDPDWIESSPSNDKAFLMIGEADHIFNVLDEPNPGYSAQVLKHTADWLERTLVDE